MFVVCKPWKDDGEVVKVDDDLEAMMSGGVLDVVISKERIAGIPTASALNGCLVRQGRSYLPLGEAYRSMPSSDACLRVSSSSSSSVASRFSLTQMGVLETGVVARLLGDTAFAAR